MQYGHPTQLAKTTLQRAKEKGGSAPSFSKKQQTAGYSNRMHTATPHISQVAV
jgi:hypothetical protein